MDNFIGAYITLKLNGFKPKITKIGNKYICHYFTSNKYFNQCAYHSFKEDTADDILNVLMVGIFVISLTGFLCAIPHILGVIAFTLVNIIALYIIMQDNRYDAIVYGSMWLCMFLIALFCIHFILADDSPEYKAFHTIYPEYLFKFKFK